MPKHTEYTVEYSIRLDSGLETSYSVNIDKETLISAAPPAEQLPQWTTLTHEQCKNCPLTGTTHCPVAARLAAPVARFGEFVSHARATTTVTTPERTYVKHGDVQDALRSLYGLIMATSGCPLTRPFKYMARYHQPFASLEETITRITSTYLMRQMFNHPDGKVMLVDIREIETLYSTMQSLNDSMARRLKSVAKQDGTLNAIIILSTYSQLIPIILKDELEKIRPLFEY